MKEIINNIIDDTALILTAPPGWGKTYKLLNAIKNKDRSRKVVFIFPLRALCDEVYLSALEANISVINIRSSRDYVGIEQINYQLFLATPETYSTSFFNTTYVHILDEFHLFYYWGDSFRQKMLDIYMYITYQRYALILLTATLSKELKQRLSEELKLNYKSIYFMDMGNQKLKNHPHKIYWYPIKLKNLMLKDLKFSAKTGVALIFCKYRQEVELISSNLRALDFHVLSCVGGQASEFIFRLGEVEKCKIKLDFIVATSVVSHGVNLPRISNIYLTYLVDNLDFYLQMIGRGGREGAQFNIHTFNTSYFSKKLLIRGGFRVLLKIFSNKMNSLLY